MKLGQATWNQSWGSNRHSSAHTVSTVPPNVRRPTKTSAIYVSNNIIAFFPSPVVVVVQIERGADTHIPISHSNKRWSYRFHMYRYPRIDTESTASLPGSPSSSVSASTAHQDGFFPAQQSNNNHSPVHGAIIPCFFLFCNHIQTPEMVLGR